MFLHGRNVSLNESISLEKPRNPLKIDKRKRRILAPINYSTTLTKGYTEASYKKGIKVAICCENVIHIRTLYTYEYKIERVEHVVVAACFILPADVLVFCLFFLSSCLFFFPSRGKHSLHLRTERLLRQLCIEFKMETKIRDDDGAKWFIALVGCCQAANPTDLVHLCISEIRHTTFLNYIKFDDILISRLSDCERLGGCHPALSSQIL